MEGFTSRWTTPCACRAAESGEHLAPQAQGLGQRQRPALQPRGERLAVEQLHRDEEPAGVFADLEDLAGVGVADAGRGAGLAPEALAALLVGAGDRLQRDAAAEARVLGRVDDAHPALSELVEDAIAADPLGQPRLAWRDLGGPGGRGRKAAEETLEPAGASDARGRVLGGQVVVGIRRHGQARAPTLPRSGRQERASGKSGSRVIALCQRRFPRLWTTSSCPAGGASA